MKLKLLLFALSLSFFSYAQVVNQLTTLTQCDDTRQDGFMVLNASTLQK